MFFAKKSKLYKVRYGKNTGNMLVLHNQDGSTVTNPRYMRGIHVRFNGQHSRVDLYQPFDLNGAKFTLFDDDHFVIGRGCSGNFFVLGGGNTRLTVGCDCGLQNAYFCLYGHPGVSICVGDGCLFSSDVTIWASDTHQILDCASGKIINNTKRSLSIGNRVWVGTRCTILKGTYISDDTIVGAASVVSGRFTESNIIIAGNPAHKIKDGVSWSPDTIPA